MKTDDFENKLRRQTPRQIPAEWRVDILRTAQSVAASERNSSRLPQSLFSLLNEKLFALLWPHPKAWAGLAAVWLVIWAMSFYPADQPIAVAKQAVPPSRELMIALREQRRELAKLVEPVVAKDAEPHRSFRPSPRSERREEMLTA